LDHKEIAALMLTDRIISIPGTLTRKNDAIIKRSLSKKERAEISLGVGLFMGMSKVLIALGLEPEEMETTIVKTPGSDT
jgi:DNA helicase HerA-like ATPase